MDKKIGKALQVADESVQSWTYFIQAGADGPIKIGKADNPEKRVAELQTGSPDVLRLIGKLKGDCEKDLHARFHKLHLRGEWFSPDVRLLAFILEHAENCGEVQGLIDAAKHLIWAFDRMREEVHQMWFAVSVCTDSVGPCKWPHVKAFDETIEILRKRVDACSK